jgi:glutaredoxin
MSTVTDPTERPYANTACPYCGAVPDPLPKAKSRCKACCGMIYVKSGPDGLRYLLQEVDRPVLEAAWTEHHEAQARAEHARRKAEAARDNARWLRDCRVAGCTAIAIWTQPDACPACKAAAGRYPIDAVPAVPTLDCTSDDCRCDYTPVD